MTCTLLPFSCRNVLTEKTEAVFLQLLLIAVINLSHIYGKILEKITQLSKVCRISLYSNIMYSKYK